MKSNLRRVASGLMVLVLLFTSGIIPAFADSIADGYSKTVTITMGTRYDFLTSTTGNSLGGEAWTYLTDTGLTGPAYCINHGLKAVPSTKKLTIGGQYVSNNYTVGAFANGYPQRSLDDFLSIYLAEYPELAGLTEAEFGYATQIAVWATLGQLAVQGTEFMSGTTVLAIPYSNAQKIRTYKAVELILSQAIFWDRQLETGMHIRLDNERINTMLDIEHDDGIHGAADRGMYGLQKETINGVEYYTRQWVASSATSTFKHDYFIELWLENAPPGTLLTSLDNTPLATVVWEGRTLHKVPTYNILTEINSNGREYRGEFKICIPARNVGDSGNIAIHGVSTVAQYKIFLANNTDHTEQSYVIADRASLIIA